MSLIPAPLLSLFYPDCCAGCNTPLFTHENAVCTSCIENLPRTKFLDDPENEVEKIFWGRVPVLAAGSFLFFVKGGILQNMLHQLKYKSHTVVGEELGRLAGGALLNSNRFNAIDCVVPIPLHEKKLKKRGYNQCSFIGEKIAEQLNADYNDFALLKVTHNESQTRKSKFQRWLNVKTIFQIAEPESIQNKHVLLIDDVVTTGSTLEAAAQKLLSVKGVRVSIFTVAFTKK